MGALAFVGRRMAKKVQIGCYLTPEEAERLRAYAEAHELRVPSLCVLLVLHELRCRQLNRLKARYLRKVGKTDGVRVTARIAERSIKDDFLEHVRTCGLGSDDAAGILFRAEPDERWLHNALGLARNRP